MIVAVTSKGGGPGCTSVSVILSLCLNATQNQKVCLVDLRNSNDIGRLLGIDTTSCIDDVITDLGFDNSFIKLSDVIYEYGGIGVIPGTAVQLNTYLYKLSTYIKNVILALDKLYDIVILDIKEGLLLSDLKSKGLNIFSVNMLEQNILTIFEYQRDMGQNNLDGLVVVNKYSPEVEPYKDNFIKNFNKKRLFFLPNDYLVKSTLNKINPRKGLDLRTLSRTDYYKEITRLADTIKNYKTYYQESQLKTEEEDIEVMISRCLDDKKSSTSKNPQKMKNIEQRNKPEKKKTRKKRFGFFRGRGNS